MNSEGPRRGQNTAGAEGVGIERQKPTASSPDFQAHECGNRSVSGTAMVEYALEYARQGWKIFRLTGSKKPFKGSHGHLDATTDREVIERWWRETPYANIGLACGLIVILDADGQGGIDKLKALVAKYSPSTDGYR